MAIYLFKNDRIDYSSYLHFSICYYIHTFYSDLYPDLLRYILQLIFNFIYNYNSTSNP